MTGRIVHFDLSGLVSVFDDMADSIESYPMALIATDMVGSVDELIDSQGNGEWDPLKDSTIRRHPRRAGGRLLQDIGLLANMQPSDGPDWAEVASPAPYSGYHVTGTRNMAKRDWTDINMDLLLDNILDSIMEDSLL
jgi:hypothetical protein